MPRTKVEFARDFSCNEFKVQVKYTTGWETVETPPPSLVCQTWDCWRHRPFHARVLCNGTVWKTNARR